MSLSTQDRPTNPSKFFMEVSGGTVHYYDKNAGETVDVPVPLEFIVLDQLATVKGFSDTDNSSYWSNEVKSSSTDPVTIRTGKGVKASGLWKEVKNDPAVSGAQFNASVYIATKGADGLEINNISFKASSLSAWIKFVQANKGVMKGQKKVLLSGFDDDKKGAVKFKVPHFEAVDIIEDELSVAKELDKELQTYLGQYFNYKPADSAAPVVPEDDVVITDISDDPINLDDIPF